MPSRGDFSVIVWGAMACLFATYTVLRFVRGSKRTDDLTSRVLEKVVRIYQRVSGST